ncbi:hypothetical protein MTO96_011665 [Rhipicephalus appendiculatus]
MNRETYSSPNVEHVSLKAQPSIFHGRVRHWRLAGKGRFVPSVHKDLTHYAAELDLGPTNAQRYWQPCTEYFRNQRVTQEFPASSSRHFGRTSSRAAHRNVHTHSRRAVRGEQWRRLSRGSENGGGAPVERGGRDFGGAIVRHSHKAGEPVRRRPLRCAVVRPKRSQQLGRIRAAARPRCCGVCLAGSQLRLLSRLACQPPAPTAARAPRTALHVKRRPVVASRLSRRPRPRRCPHTWLPPRRGFGRTRPTAPDPCDRPNSAWRLAPGRAGPWPD